MKGKVLLWFFACVGYFVVGDSALAEDKKMSTIEARQVVKERQAAFVLVQRNYKSLVASVKRNELSDKESLAERAEHLHLFSEMIIDMFPAGSNIKSVSSKSTEDVWNSPTDFMAQYKGYVDQTKNLSLAIATMEGQELKEKIMKIGAECKGCHKKYKQK